MKQSKRRTGGRVLMDALRVHGVDTVFCVPGESYLAALDALHATRDDLLLVIGARLGEMTTRGYRLVMPLRGSGAHR